MLRIKQILEWLNQIEIFSKMDLKEKAKTEQSENGEADSVSWMEKNIYNIPIDSNCIPMPA